MTIIRPPLPFQISWAPTKDAERLSAERGRKEGDGTSFWDWIEEDQITLVKPRSTFDGAVIIAREKLPLDVSGQVRIARLRTIVEDGRDTYVEDAIWHLSDPDEALTEDAPHLEPEID